MKQGGTEAEYSWQYSLPEYCALRMFKKLGYFVTESSEHFAEYTRGLLSQVVRI